MTVAVRDLAVRRGDALVLDGVSIDAAEGELLGVVGPNGAGKTTLLRTVSGALSPERGSVAVLGDEVHALSSREASRRVASVPQDTSLSFDFTVREVVGMGRHPHRPRFGSDPDPGRVDRALDRADVARFADRPITTVSGGERQRVLLARALAQDAPVLLLDEPTASLDVNHQVRTLELARDLVGEGRTALAAIHDLNLAARYCDRLVLLAGGGVVDAGLPADVLTESNLRTAFDARAVVREDPIEGAPLVTALPDATADRDATVHVVGGGGAAAPLLPALATAGFDVTVGVVPAGDRDADVAGALGFETVTVPAFAGVDGDAERRAVELVRAADATVVPDLDLHAGVRPNLDAAAAADALVLVDGEATDGRRGADRATRERYRLLSERASVVAADAVPSAVDAALRDDAGRVASPPED